MTYLYFMCFRSANSWEDVEKQVDVNATYIVLRLSMHKYPFGEISTHT